MIPYPEALQRILQESVLLDTESVEVTKASGRFCAADLLSPIPLPGFRNSAMDGFALATGGREVPSGTHRHVAGSLAAGDAPMRGDEGKAWEIMTGAPVPDGLDAVIPVEEVHVDEERDGRPVRIRLAASVRPGQHVRPAGRDFATGDPVVERGRRLGPADIMALSALGLSRVSVVRHPRAQVICTGPELVDDPGQPLAPGQIRNSNGPFLCAYLQERGAKVASVRTLGDEVEPFLAEIDAAVRRGTEIVVSTGAVSMGRHDFVPRALEKIGAKILFHRVAMRPGKPHLAARLPEGGMFFGLPGNPISAVVGARFFIEPFLRASTGRAPEEPWQLPLTEDVEKRGSLRYFSRATIRPEGSRGLAVHVLAGQQSFRISPLLRAEAWAVLPEGPEHLSAGTPVSVHALYGSPHRNSDRAAG